MNKIEKNELLETISDNKRNITIFVIIGIVLTLIAIVILYTSNKNINSNTDNNNITSEDISNTESNTKKEIQIVPNTECAFTSEGLITDREPTTLESLGLKEKMFTSKIRGKDVCSNCSRRLDADDDTFTIVLTEQDSFAKIILCDKCFPPFGELLKTIGF